MNTLTKYKIIPLIILLSFSSIISGCIFDDETKNINNIAHNNGKIDINVNTNRSSYNSEEDLLLGSANENKISVLHLYLFDSYTKLFKKAILLTELEEESCNELYAKYRYEGIEIEKGIYDIFAIANNKYTISCKNEDQLLSYIDSNSYRDGIIETTSENGFVLTSRAEENRNIIIADSDYHKSVTINLERVVSKIEIGVKNNYFSLYNGNNKYADIKITNYKIVNTPRSYFLFRHTAKIEDFDAFKKSPSYKYGDITECDEYVIDPYFLKKDNNAINFTNNDNYYSNALVNINTNINWASINVEGNYSFVYVLENCIYKQFQKNAYTTGIIFKSSILPCNNVYKLDKTTNSIVRLTNKEDWTTPLYYYNYNFYTSLSAIKESGNIKIDVEKDFSDSELLNYKIKRFHKKNGTYQCYYFYWIKNNMNNQLEDDYIKYGIIRNNIYRIQISNVKHLGIGTIEIDPDRDDNSEIYNIE